METRKKWIPIKLKAVDDKDLQIFSQFLYESIVLPSEIKFEKKNQRFAMAIERFTWEHAKDESHLLMQVLSILVINYVEKVDLKSKSMFSGTLHFDMISDKSAVLGGIGRGNGDVLRILENGNLYYSGLEFVKIK